jgi:radical SAM/Cys-rich protein
VSQARTLGKKILVRSNLTVLTTRKMEDMPVFFAENQVTVISSLPCYTAENTDRQRGDGVFERSIEALRKLNELGYGHEGSGLELHLVYNPGGPSLPPDQELLKADYKRVLAERFGIVFNELFCITNMPISRFLDDLIQQGKLAGYMHKLVDAFNPSAAEAVMCRNTLSVGWDGRLYDCDFNQMLELEVNSNSPRHIKDFHLDVLAGRQIVTRRHCFGCTAGAGSSCKGEIV